MERLVLKMRWEESMRWAIDLDLSKGKIGFSIKCLANLVIKDSLSTVIFMNALAFCKSSEELWCVKVKLLHILESTVFQKAGFIWFTKRIYYIFGFKRHFLHLERANKWAHYCLNNSFHWLCIFTTFFHPYVFP